MMYPIDTNSLQVLRNRLSSTASVHLRDEPGYSIKRWAENAEKPAIAVAYPANADDVAELLAFVQGKGLYVNQVRLDVAIKSSQGGGHSASGASSTDGGLVVDLEPHLHDVRIDAEHKLAYVGGGALWKHVDQAAAEHGKWKLTYDLSIRLSLGGGRGWLTGQHGLVIDNIVQATVVTASGDILVASEAENPDLFWAIRGGGGNFGVVTEFVFGLHPQRATVLHHFFVFAPKVLHRLVDEINAWMKHRNDTENGSLMFALCPMGKPVIVLQMIYNGDSEEGREKYQRFVDLGPMMHRPETIREPKFTLLAEVALIIDTNQRNHVLQARIARLADGQLQDTQSAHGENKLFRGNFIPATPIGIPPLLMTALFDAWLDFVSANTVASKSNVLIELYHPDKSASVPNTATAFAFRQPNYAVLLTMHWSDPSFTPRASAASIQIDDAFEKARALAFSPAKNVGGAYINYLDEESRVGATKTQTKFGPNYARLVEAKLKYDPDRVFGKWFAVLDSKRRDSRCSEPTGTIGLAQETAVVS
ncbi:hypothetical protein FRC09_020634 [Ceratobasidium sp. 395]|nr:hypothetical protein FRC09_020634 [Ceratobasidium sp. 395]